MTVIAVLADPPRPGLVLPDLAGTSPLSETEAADLYAAMLKDVVVAAERSGGDLLVNYRPDDLLPEPHRRETGTEAAVRAAVADALGGAEGVRFEVQVGSTVSARAGNTITHLLREEGAASAAVVRPTAPLLSRTDIDSAAMKLRSSPVVLGPATRGRVGYAGFTRPIEFAEAFAPPALSTLAARGRDADLDVAFLGLSPAVERGEDLLSLLPLLDARRRAGAPIPRHTVEFVEDLGLRIAADGDELRLVRR